jgi:hypothetical protein
MLPYFPSIRILDIYGLVSRATHNRSTHWDVYVRLVDVIAKCLTQTLEKLRLPSLWRPGYRIDHEAPCFPDLSRFLRLRQLLVPKDVLAILPTIVFKDPKIILAPLEHLPPNLETLTILDADKCIFDWVKAFVPQQDMFPQLKRVTVLFARGQKFDDKLHADEGFESMQKQDVRSGF